MTELGIFHANNRDYSSWDIIKSEKNRVCKDFDPVKIKALSGDIVLDNGNIHKTSEVRNHTNHYAGVLALNSPTYGRHTNNKFLYKCIPGHTHMPIFLIPYDIHEKRKNRLSRAGSISNSIPNYYVLFRFVEWKEKHPIGCIVDIIGPVFNLSYFYKYQIYLENLYFPKSKRNNFIRKKINSLVSINETKETKETKETNIVKSIAATVENIVDRTEEHIISIDPDGSLDLDDALGCVKIADDLYKVSVFIANVPVWLSALNYWEQLPPTPATIYMPDIKHPMLPNILGDNLISLIQKTPRLALAMDMYITPCGITHKIEFTSAIIKVRNNFTYSNNLENHQVYSGLYELAIKCNKVRRYMDCIENSHDTVAFWMLCMNHEIGLKLQYKHVGIFRSTSASDVVHINNSKKQQSILNIPKSIVKMANNWNKERAKYTNAKSNNGHCYIGDGITAYAHSTSPIRRIVDIINLTRLQMLLGIMKPTNEILNICNRYENNVNAIDQKMNAIKKVQNKCEVLYKCSHVEPDTNHIGYVIACENKENTESIMKFTTTYAYTIFIPTLNIVSYIDSQETWQLFSKKIFQIHVFEDEITLHRKIKIKHIK